MTLSRFALLLAIAWAYQNSFAQSTAITVLNLWQNPIHTYVNKQTPEIVSKTGAIRHIFSPRMELYLPDKNSANGIAILVMSGGGYTREALGNEGIPASIFLQKQGFTVFNLIYRLPKEHNNMVNAPFADGQRAIRLIRANAAQYGYDSNKIGVLGFSAGGHLASMLATRWNHAYYPPQDQYDQISARPDFAALIYPVISMLAPINITRAYQALMPQQPTLKDQQNFSAQLWVNNRTPATFIAHAIDDHISPVANSQLMFAALQKQHVPSELKLFAHGGHGWGMGKANTETVQWSALFIDWIKQLYPTQLRGVDTY
ncbi:MAG: alpha/beta hydrolase [Acinetobacter sp.]